MGLVLVALRRARPDLLLGEGARERAKLLLLVGQRERDAARVVSTVAIGTLRKSRLTSQSMSVDGRRPAVKAPRSVSTTCASGAGTPRAAPASRSSTGSRGRSRPASAGPCSGRTAPARRRCSRSPVRSTSPRSGTVEILGETMGRTDLARLRESIGFVDTRVGGRFAPLLTVRQVVRTGATATIGYFEERLSGLDLDRADELVGTFGLGPDRRAAFRRLLRGGAEAGADRAGARRAPPPAAARRAGRRPRPPRPGDAARLARPRRAPAARHSRW